MDPNESPAPIEEKTGKQVDLPKGAGGTPRKTPKTAPLIETIDKTIALLHEEPQNSRSYTTKNAAHPRRTGKQKWPRFSSQHIRRDIARSLGKLYDEALEGSSDKTLLGITYPKGKSKLAKEAGTDINRDSVRAYGGDHGLRAVGMVSIDADWSALRLKLT